MSAARADRKEQGEAGAPAHGTRGCGSSETLLIVVAIAYAMAAGYMYLNQRSFLFVPTGALATPRRRGSAASRSKRLPWRTGRRHRLAGAAVASRMPTVLYLHGNSSNVSARYKRFEQILDSGYGLYAPSYRGYAGSEGQPVGRRADLRCAGTFRSCGRGRRTGHPARRKPRNRGCNRGRGRTARCGPAGAGGALYRPGRHGFRTLSLASGVAADEGPDADPRADRNRRNAGPDPARHG